MCILKMIEEIITTENPERHWGFVNVKGRTVLDLGCGRVWNTDRQRSSDKHLHWPDTPEFFLSRGAKKVIGVDPRRYEIERFQDEYMYKDGKGEFQIGEIKEKEDMELFLRYLIEHGENCVKCDIEHFEGVITKVDDVFINRVDEWYVECHTNELFDRVVGRLMQSHDLFYVGHLVHSSPEAKVVGLR